MKILVVARGCPNSRYPLNGIFELQQARALAAAGHSVAYAALDLRSLRRRRALGFSQKQLDGVRVYTLAVPLGAVGRGLFDRIGFRALSRLYNKITADFGVPDVVHSHFLDYTVLAGLLCEKNSLPLVATEHSSLLNSNSIPAALRERARTAYSRAAAVVAVSEPFAQKLRALTDMPVYTVFNSVDLSRFTFLSAKPAPDKNALRFVSTGSLKANKGFDLLVAAFAEYRKKYPGARLKIYGAGEQLEALRGLIGSLGCAESVTLCGYAEPEVLNAAYSAADVFVLASRGETFGVVYAEAMAAGLPVIATRCGAPESFVSPECGLLVTVGDADAVLDGLYSMTENIAQYSPEKISQYARDIFSPQALVKALEIVYGAALSSRKEAGA